nr:CDT1-like protein a, chloroplastic [Malus domestica]
MEFEPTLSSKGSTHFHHCSKRQLACNIHAIWRFTISHLAQLKFILPEVIEITKVLVKDGRTIDIKPDIRVTMNVDAVENDDKLKYEVRIWVLCFQGYEILEETLPQPFNCAEQYMHPDTIKCSLSSSPNSLTSVHTVEQPEAFKTSLQGNATTDETHSTPSEQSKEDLNSNISEIPDPSLPTETSFEAPIEQLPFFGEFYSFRAIFQPPRAITEETKGAIVYGVYVLFSLHGFLTVKYL